MAFWGAFRQLLGQQFLGKVDQIWLEKVILAHIWITWATFSSGLLH